MIEAAKLKRTGESGLRENPERRQFLPLTQSRHLKFFSANRVFSFKIFVTCWLIFTIHFATNTVREIYPALSLADNFSFDVTEYAELHPDIFIIEGRGAFINNNPGASMMGAIPYFLLKPVTDRIIEKVKANRAVDPPMNESSYESIYPMAREFYLKSRAKGFDVKFGLAAAIMQSLLMAPLSALSVVVMFQILQTLTKNRRQALWLALLYAFATPVFYRTAQLNQNLLIAHFALFSFVLLWRFQKNTKPFYLAAGLCAGWTLVLDYSGIVTVTVLSVYAVARWFSFAENERRLEDLLKFGAGVALCCGILAAYQWACFGNPFLPAQAYMPPANFTEQGYRGLSLPQFDLLMQTAFSMRYGLFISAPLLLLALLFPFFRNGERLLPKNEAMFCVALTLLFFIFCAANQYGRMQFNSGVRHIVPVVPFVFLLTAEVLWRLPKSCAVLLGIGGVYWSWCLAMYRDVEQGTGILEAVKSITLEGFRLPWLTTIEKMGYVQNTSVFPIFLLCAAFLWVLWKTDFYAPKKAI